MKLSIILTVYNKEPFLRRALDSLLNQEGIVEGEYEVLAVNDGSIDGSASILEEYSQRDNRVRILTQKNQGLSMARNNGTEEAKGDYVWFVDADDTVSENSVAQIINLIGLSPDVIPIYAVTDGVKTIRNKINPNINTGREVLIEGKWEHCGVFWIFRKSFLKEKELRFIPGIFHEDAEFTPRMLYSASSVKVLPEVLYKVYRGDEQSITKVPRPQRAYDMVYVVKQLMSFFKANNEQGSDVDKIMCNNNAGLLNTAMFVITCNNKEEWSRFNKHIYNNKSVLRNFSKSSLLKNRLEGCLFHVFPKHCVNVFYYVRKIIS